MKSTRILLWISSEIFSSTRFTFSLGLVEVHSQIIEVTRTHGLPHSLEGPAALLNVSAVVGRAGQVELEHGAEGEVGDAAHEAALAPERRHGKVLGVEGAA